MESLGYLVVYSFAVYEGRKSNLLKNQNEVILFLILFITWRCCVGNQGFMTKNNG